jgi:hypothetical protein
MSAPDDDVDLSPILGEIAREWERIHPRDLTASEALSLLGVITRITDRLDAEADVEEIYPPEHRPALRLVRDEIECLR